MANRKGSDRFAKISASELNESEQRTLVALALSVLAERHRPGLPLAGPAEVTQYLRLKVGDHNNEVFGCLFLDTRHQLISIEEIFQGTIDGATVYPRVVVQRALERNASAVILYHNHPSGVAEPSEADRTITLKLAKALALVDIRLLDHLVVTCGSHVSLAERGWI